MTLHQTATIIVVAIWLCAVPSAADDSRKSGGRISVERTSSPDWYGGLALRITSELMSGTEFVLWPQEAWSVKSSSVDDWEFVRMKHVDDFTQSEDGTVRYTTKNLMFPEVNFTVEIAPRRNAIDIALTVENTSSDSLYVGSGPCLQLPENRFGGAPESRANRVFVIDESWRLTWTSETKRSPGSRSNAPWSQLYLALQNPTSPVKHGFGLSPERVATGLVGAVSEDGEIAAAFVTDSPASVAYAFMNCIHANVGMLMPPGATVKNRSRVYFDADGVNSLLQRIRSDFPSVLPDSVRLIVGTD